MYDLKTKNESFLRQHEILKKQGIKNNKFFLLLNNPNLSGVDPYNPDLSNQIKAQIIKECMDNYWYFLREIVRLPYMGDTKSYKLNSGNLAFNFCVMNNLNVFFEMPLVETGKTLSVLSRLLWENIFIYNFYGYKATLMSKKFDDAKSNIYILNDMFDILPDYVKSSFTRNPINALPTPITREAIKAISTGLTSSRLYMDQFTYMRNNKKIYTALLPTFRAYNQIHRKNGLPSGIIITTMPGDIKNTEAWEAYMFEQICYPFTEMFYDMPVEDLETIINDGIFNGFMLIKYNYEQLGLDEQWFKQRCLDLNKDHATIKREVLLDWLPDVRPEDCQTR